MPERADLELVEDAHPDPAAPSGWPNPDHDAGGRGTAFAEAAPLIKTLVRAHRWRRRIRRSDVAEHGPCRAEGVTDAYVCRLLSLTCFAGHRRSDTRRTAAEGVEALPMGSGMDRLPGTPRGRPGASAIDYEAAQEVRRGAAQLVLKLKQAAWQRVSTRLSGLSRKQPCGRVAWDARA